MSEIREEYKTGFMTRILDKLRFGEFDTTSIGLWLKWPGRNRADDLTESVMAWLLSEARLQTSNKYKTKAFLAWAKTLPEPYLTEAYNILANGKPEP